MLVSAQELLKNARTHQYAVAGFNCVEDILIRTALDTAEETNSPVFIMGCPKDLENRGIQYIAGIVRAVEKYYSVPIVLHLDHSSTLELVQKALDFGFNSVMIDASDKPFEQNADLAAKAVEMSKPYGAAVEAELGLVGGEGLDLNSEQVANRLTEPEEVIRYVQWTGVDSLAVSIGTAHGVYRQLPTLDITRLKKLNEVSPIPLVLHGGSGTPEDQLREAVQNGACKLNIYTDYRVAVWNAFKHQTEIETRSDALPVEYFGRMRQEASELVRAKFDLTNSLGKAPLFK